MWPHLALDGNMSAAGQSRLVAFWRVGDMHRIRKYLIGGLLAIGAVVALSACNALDKVVEVAAGDGFTCARHEDGTVTCWGANTPWGQLGDGVYADSALPVRVQGLAGVTSLVAGNDHACAGLSDGTARCWGANEQGQLGDGTTITRPTPVPVSGLTGVTRLSAGAGHTCARLGTGTVKCWGSNNWGQLGDGTTAGRLTPVAVSGLTGVTDISAGPVHTCARLGTGAARCWGSNDSPVCQGEVRHLV
jgi:alpha-tubulin suppressor-like RCC1 family protein